MTPSHNVASGDRILILLPPEAVPDGWQDRVVPISLVALWPSEVNDLLDARPVVPRADEMDLSLLRLLGRGWSVDQIAAEVALAPRSVYRRLASLRLRLGANSNAELAGEAIRSGLR